MKNNFSFINKIKKQNHISKHAILKKNTLLSRKIVNGVITDQACLAVK